MNQMHRLIIALFFTASSAVMDRCIEAAEPLLRELPPGLVVEKSTELPPDQVKAIAEKLGGDIERLTNSMLNVQGRKIQVNVIAARDESNATNILAALSKIKSYPFCMRKGQVVVEYVGKDIDAALATKTSYELRLQPKPEKVHYRVIADLAAVEKADYMACNPLFNQFLLLQGDTEQAATQQILQLSKKFQFGRTLVLRNPKLDEAVTHQFRPLAISSTDGGATIAYSFDECQSRLAVPYVTATIDIAVDATGFRESAAAPPKSLTAATAFWPADDERVSTLARQITRGKTTNTDKAFAILEWLSPGRNVRYAGQTGTRWGVARFLEQKFGQCWDFSDCFVTLSRAAGVPCRQVAGWLYGTSGHVWAEFYVEDKGWQQIDPTGGGKLRCGIYHIAYFTSEDGEMPIVYVSMPSIEVVTAP